MKRTNHRFSRGWLFGKGPAETGANGFDWMAAGWGGVPWLISWPR